MHHLRSCVWVAVEAGKDALKTQGGFGVDHLTLILRHVCLWAFVRVIDYWVPVALKLLVFEYMERLFRLFLWLCPVKGLSITLRPALQGAVAERLIWAPSWIYVAWTEPLGTCENLKKSFKILFVWVGPHDYQWNSGCGSLEWSSRSFSVCVCAVGNRVLVASRRMIYKMSFLVFSFSAAISQSIHVDSGSQ